MKRAGSLRRVAALLAAGVLIAFVVGTLYRTMGSPARSAPLAGRVTYVYDGDTIEVAEVGKVRLIGIDALDAHNEGKTWQQAARYGLTADQVRLWAARASQFARERLQGGQVMLHRGRQATGDYGRVLAYVEVDGGADGRDFNLQMIRRGLAAAYRRYPHARRGRYLRAEKEARRKRAGFWADARRTE